MRNLCVGVAATAFARFLAAGLDAALAKGGPKGFGGHGHGHGAGMPPGFGKGHKVAFASYVYPPGWNHGRKRGWRGAGVPPGWR
jgi:hypothetical protein